MKSHESLLYIFLYFYIVISFKLQFHTKVVQYVYADSVYIRMHITDIRCFMCVWNSGGLEITVSGHHLNVVQKPYIHFSLNGSYFRQVGSCLGYTK